MTSPASGGSVGDADLLAAHVAGSETAFAELVRRHQNRLWAVALRMMRDPDDAADVVQDALVKAFRRADGFRGDAAVSTWLHRIVVTTALDALRAGARASATSLVDLDPPDPHDHVSARETQADVVAALAAIPADQRAAIVLVDIGGLSMQEAAWSLQCAPGTVKSRCSRGRARLAALLSGYDLRRAPGPGTPTGSPAADPAGNQEGSGRVQDDGPRRTAGPAQHDHRGEERS